MSDLRSSGSPGMPSPREQRPDMSVLIPRQRPASEPGAGRPANEARTRPRRRWSPLLAAGSVVLGTACAGAGVISTDLPKDVSDVPMTEMNAPQELAPEPVAPALPVMGRARPPGAAPVAPRLVRVRYELDGAAVADMISFTTGQASPVTEVSGVRLPWEKEFNAAGGFVPSVSAQGVGPGPISCRITVDGEVVSAVTLEGMNAVVTCTAQALAQPG
jgi:MmpS family membrane protein